MTLNGQWIGRYEEPLPGHLIIDVDYLGDGYFVTAALNPDDRDIPSSTASFNVAPQPSHFHVEKIPVHPIIPETGETDFAGVVKQKFPQFNFARNATVTGSWSDDSLSVEWTTDLGTKGSAKLPRSRSSEPSDYSAATIGWDQFKTIVGSFEHRRYIFRGQSKCWRLRTAFHRTGRASLIRFRFEDIPVLQRHLSGLTRHHFDLSIPDQYGAFLNLVQHHGYPTPLLDWTYSPYVAAFFAFREVTKRRIRNSTEHDFVRVAVFDQKAWKLAFNQHLRLSGNRENFSLLDPLAIDNPRMIPQQAVVSVANVDDIETYIKNCEAISGKSFLQFFDISVTVRDEIMRELSSMGVTAGSLFPGIDGACEELRERNFRT
jgi:hypothetical protein